MKSYNDKAQVVGQSMANKYVTHREKNKHFMRKFQGFGVSKRILDEQKALGCETVIIIYHGNKTIMYSCPIQTFIDSTKIHVFEDTDIQHFVSTKDMEIVDEN